MRAKRRFVKRAIDLVMAKRWLKREMIPGEDERLS